jgi:glycosyltransferase involved in cell wall biosynthesis
MIDETRAILTVEMQTLIERYEVILADGNSTDRTREIAESLGAIVVPNGQLTVAHGRQAGFEHAKGDLVVFCDADMAFDASDYERVPCQPLLIHFVEKDLITAAQVSSVQQSDWRSWPRPGRYMSAYLWLFFVPASTWLCGHFYRRKNSVAKIALQPPGSASGFGNTGKMPQLK